MLKFYLLNVEFLILMTLIIFIRTQTVSILQQQKRSIFQLMCIGYIKLRLPLLMGNNSVSGDRQATDISISFHLLAVPHLPPTLLRLNLIFIFRDIYCTQFCTSNTDSTIFLLKITYFILFKYNFKNKYKYRQGF